MSEPTHFAATAHAILADLVTGQPPVNVEQRAAEIFCLHCDRTYIVVDGDPCPTCRCPERTCVESHGYTTRKDTR